MPSAPKTKLNINATDGFFSLIANWRSKSDCFGAGIAVGVYASVNTGAFRFLGEAFNTPTKRPYDGTRPVVCMDETNKQLIKETRTPIPASPGESVRYDAEYERNGVCNVFLSCEPLKGKRTTKVTDQRKKTDWAHFIKELVDVDYPSVLVMDNLNTHAGSSLYEALNLLKPKEYWKSWKFITRQSMVVG